MKRIIAFALSLITIATLTTHITTAQLASAADKPPRKVITGWLPYYSVRTIMPLVRKLPTAQESVAGSAEFLYKCNPTWSGLGPCGVSIYKGKAFVI